MKKVLTAMMAVFLCLNIVLADGADTNIDGGGGAYGETVGGYLWNEQDGVRISIYDANGKKLGNIIDYTNYDVDVKKKKHYHKKSKLEYLSGLPLALEESEKYSRVIPAKKLPVIINRDMDGGDSKARISAIKKYFSDSETIRLLLDKAGVSYKFSKALYASGPEGKIEAENIFFQSVKGWSLVLEPIAYFNIDGRLWAMTTMESLKFPFTDNLRKYIPSLMKKNLPLALYLEKDHKIGSFTLKAYGGGGAVLSDETIRDYLGLAVIHLNKEPPKPKPESKPIVEDYNYRVDTNVMTSFNFTPGDFLSGSGIDSAKWLDYTPDDPLNFRFSFKGYDIGDVSVGGIYCPKNDSTLVWVPWKTPPTERIVEITVTAIIPYKGEEEADNSKVSKDTPSGKKEEEKVPREYLEVEIGSLTAKIGLESEMTPPDPQPKDRYDGFLKDFDEKFNPHKEEKKEVARWRTWDCDSGSEGNWILEEVEHEVRLTTKGGIFPARLTPTASKGSKSMKSGYGIESDIEAVISGNIRNATSAQRVKMYFPEFLYKDYNRLLEKKGNKFVFQKNKYSQEFYLPSNDKSRIHFTPIWYPDTKYQVKAKVYDVWTPAGEMVSYVERSILISGDMYDDWRIIESR